MSIEDAYIELLKSNKLRQQTIIKLSKENKKLKEENFKLGQIDIKKVILVENRQLEEENAKLKETLEEIRNICRPLLKVNNIEKLEGKHLTGKYNLAKEIMEVLKDE